MRYLLLFLILFPLLTFANCIEMNEGRRCFTKLASYPQPVFIFIPKQFNSEKNYSLLLYLHGHLLPNTSFESDVLSRFQFEQKLSKLNRNLIMVMPMSSGPAQDYDDYFFRHPQAKDNFFLFMSDLNEYLVNQKIPFEKQHKLVLAGHSGAYRHLATFMNYDLPKLSEVYLFDCLYNKYEAPQIFAETFLRFKEENKRILSIYKIDSATDQSNFEMWLAINNLPQGTSKRKFYQESVSIENREQMKKLQQNFVKTQKNHYQIVDDFFIWALESGEK